MFCGASKSILFKLFGHRLAACANEFVAHKKPCSFPETRKKANSCQKCICFCAKPTILTSTSRPTRWDLPKSKPPVDGLWITLESFSNHFEIILGSFYYLWRTLVSCWGSFRMRVGLLFGTIGKCCSENVWKPFQQMLE